MNYEVFTDYIASSAFTPRVLWRQCLIPPNLGNSVRIINIKNNLNPLVCQPSDHSLQLPSRPGLLLSQGRFNDADTEMHVHIVISRVFTFSLLYEDIRHCQNKKKKKHLGFLKNIITRVDCLATRRHSRGEQRKLLNVKLGSSWASTHLTGWEIFLHSNSLEQIALLGHLWLTD